MEEEFDKPMQRSGCRSEKVWKKERGKRNEKARGEKRKEGGVKCVDRILFIVLSVDSP